MTKRITVVGNPVTWAQDLPANHSKYSVFYSQCFTKGFCAGPVFFVRGPWVLCGAFVNLCGSVCLHICGLDLVDQLF